MNIVYIHGNGASSDSFNFIRSQLSEHKSIVLEYESTNGFYNNFQQMLEQLKHVDEIFFIAHSLGGIYALHLADELRGKVLGAVTMSTPYGGSKAAQAVKYVLPFNRVLLDIQPTSSPIVEGTAMEIVHPWTNIVTLDGHSPFMLEANDGVVTHESMRQRQADMTLIDVNSNHFEVVLNNDVVAIIKKAVRNAERKTKKGQGVFA